VYKERTPLRRNIELDDVADAAIFLLSGAGRGVTGEVLMVDAGFHIMGGA
jgi:enoyl-[acyl-carrier protein] reductase I